MDGLYAAPAPCGRGKKAGCEPVKPRINLREVPSENKDAALRLIVRLAAVRRGTNHPSEPFENMASWHGARNHGHFYSRRPQPLRRQSGDLRCAGDHREDLPDY